MQTNALSKSLALDADLGKLDVGTLQLAFSRFSEASTRLEQRYQELCAETEELRARLREKDAEIARSAGLAMLGEAAAAIAHEVRNPLGSIKLFISLIRSDVGERPETIELLDGVDRSLGNIDNVVANILQFARCGDIKRAPVNLHALIQEQLSAVVSARGSSLKTRLELNAKPFVLGSEHGLRQVFHNLFMNSCQALHDSGEIAVCTRSEAGNCLVVVRDSGPGVPEKLIERIFEPFVTSKNEGTGLGLAIVRKILVQHGASISVANDSGAVFSLRIPQEFLEEK